MTFFNPAPVGTGSELDIGLNFRFSITDVMSRVIHQMFVNGVV